MNLYELANTSMMHGVPPSQIVAVIKESVSAQKHEQKLSTLERSLREYPLALSALNFAKLYHTGMRKDGVTPEFDHQVSIVRFILKLAPYLMHPDETLAVGFLHDVSEDYSIPFTEIAKKFNTKISRGVNLVTKKFDGVSRREDKLFQLMAQHPVASIVKGVDRIHNQSTMEPFTNTKKGEYLDFTDGNIIPMLLEAKNNFPTQSDAYDMILRVLGYQEKTYRADESTLTYDEYVESDTDDAWLEGNSAVPDNIIAVVSTVLHNGGWQIAKNATPEFDYDYWILDITRLKLNNDEKYVKNGNWVTFGYETTAGNFGIRVGLDGGAVQLKKGGLMHYTVSSEDSGKTVTATHPKTKPNRKPMRQTLWYD